MNERPDDLAPRLPADELAAPGDDDAQADLDSEPRRKWKPNPELLAALAAAQKDLKPGEASLFWDWTATRDSAPEAEDVRPSDRGELLVSDKDAAAAYVPPVEVAPARAPRAATKSRIRVREDVDPRRQPTMKTSRGSDPASGPSSDSAPPSGQDRTSDPMSDRPSITLVSGRMPLVPGAPGATRSTRRSLAEERRRRVAALLVLGIVTGTFVFFWLRLPRDLDARIGGDGPAPTVEVAPRSAQAHPPSPEEVRLPPNAVEEPAPVVPAVVPPAKSAAPPKTTPITVSKSTPTAAPSQRPILRPKTPTPPATTVSGGSGFLIRKKGE